MSTDDKPCQATPSADLRQQIMDSRVPKNEREWWASRTIEKLETELAAARSERDLAITRVASILWSGAIDKHTCGDVQKWAADYTAELARLRADLERFTGHGLLDCHAICDQRDTAVARAEKAEAEVERLKKQIKDDNRAYGCELRDPNGTIWEQAAKDHARAERAEAERLEQARLLGMSGEREAALLSALKLMVSKFDAFIDSEYCGTDLLAEQLAQADFARKVIMGEARK